MIAPEGQVEAHDRAEVDVVVPPWACQDSRASGHQAGGGQDNVQSGVLRGPDIGLAHGRRQVNSIVTGRDQFSGAAYINGIATARKCLLQTSQE